MANGNKDRIQVTTTTTGIGTYTVGTTPATGCRAFTAIADGLTVTYCAESADRTVWEVNEGVLGGTGTTLTRGTLIASSTGSAINWTAGTRNIYCCPSAERVGDVRAANNLSDLASVSTARTNLDLGTLATQSGTFSGTSSGTNTGDQTTVSGNSGSTDALKSATTTVNVVAATAPSIGQVLTATGASAATWQTPSSGVTGFTSSQNTSSPNSTVNASRLLASASSTNADFVLQPKGTGAILAQLPDSTTAGGNKRGANSVDLQTKRSAASQVAVGTYSVISGGYGNTAGNNARCTVGGGQLNASTGTQSTISGGSFNTASGDNSFIGGGENNVSSGTASGVLGGYNNTASGNSSSVPGGRRAHTRGIYGCAAIASGRFGTDGDSQRGQYILRCLTTNTTATTLTADQGAASTTNQVVLPNNSSYLVRGVVNSHRTDVIGTSSTWSFIGAIRRGANAAATTLVAAITPTLVAQDAAATTWSVAVTADSTNGCLKIAFTGLAATTIRTVALIETVEVTS